MKLHRAVVLILMFMLAALLLIWAVLVGVATASAQSLIALAVVLGGAIVAGAAFSLRRYFPRR